MALFLSPSTSHEHQFFGVTSGFTRLVLKSKYDFLRPFIHEGQDQHTNCTAHGEPLLWPCLRTTFVMASLVCIFHNYRTM